MILVSSGHIAWWKESFIHLMDKWFSSRYEVCFEHPCTRVVVWFPLRYFLMKCHFDIDSYDVRVGRDAPGHL